MTTSELHAEAEMVQREAGGELTTRAALAARDARQGKIISKL